MMEHALEHKMEVVRDKIRLWQNTYYSSQLDVQIGKDITDSDMVQRAKVQMKKCLRAIALLEKVLTSLGSKNEKDPSCNGGS